MTAGREAFGLLYQSEFDRVAQTVMPSATVLYCALATMRNGRTKETCPVGIELLAQKTGQTRRTVFRGLSTLVDEGFIVKHAHGKRLTFSFPLVANGDTDDA